ncbi:MAG: tat (twin-arginine translocation) pathway signal sequence domain protein [Pseudoduganella sp.]|jgi:membrane dipeptidase|nr:tat (twin-arginine translocation) pathway signal sequence domain protein [Pseudoduganella sp.]
MTQRRRFLQGAAALGLGAACLSPQALAEGAARTRRPLIIDALAGIANPNRPQAELDDREKSGVDARSLADARQAGLAAFNMTIGYVFGKDEPYERSVRDVAAWHELLRVHGDALLLVRQANDIRRAHAERRTGVILGFQNAAMMGSDVRRVETFANLGVRVVQLTYNGSNQLGDGAMAASNRGLTPFGREVVQALNRQRVLVDLSHSGEQICLDAAAASSQPIAITHTGCRALADLPRNKSDRELRMVAEKGGFVGIYFMPFLAIGRQPTATDLVAHIEHALKVCGEDHVGIGSDGNVSAIDDMPAYMRTLELEIRKRRAAGISAPGERPDIVPFLPDLQGPDKYLRLADMLAKRGHPASRIEKVLGLNFLRLAGHIWG